MFLLDETRAVLIQLVATLKAIELLCNTANQKLTINMWTFTISQKDPTYDSK